MGNARVPQLMGARRVYARTHLLVCAMAVHASIHPVVEERVVRARVLPHVNTRPLAEAKAVHARVLLAIR
jgi:hypothetical protein